MKKTMMILLVALAVICLGSYTRSRYGHESWAPVMVVKTISLNDDASTDDYQCDDDAANSTEQVITLTNILPAYAELTSVQIRCFETVTGSATVQIEMGTTSSGNQIFAFANIDSANDISTGAAGGSPILAATNAARSLYVTIDPTAVNWSTLNAGRWAILLIYIDYANPFTQGIPR
jgi:hypothetical protein